MMKDLFPIFTAHPQLAYLDNASTTQKPHAVIEAEMAYYQRYAANIHRGIYDIAAQATDAYERTRQQVAEFIGAASADNVIFTRGTTESANLVAQSFLLPRLSAGDEVIITAMEHHSNLIPWQQACLQKNARLVVVPFDADSQTADGKGTLDWSFFEKALNERTRLVAVTHISNTLGTVNPIAQIVAKAHENGVPVFIDAAQSITTHAFDVSQLGVDFLAFSSHKIFGPTGVGVLYGAKKHLEAMLPYQFGGDMIRDVTFEKTLFARPPQKFEAGTPNIAGVIGLGKALEFVQSVGQSVIAQHVDALQKQATAALSALEGVTIVGQAPQKSGIVSFVLRGAHPHDVATILGQNGVCIRAGHHCTQPIMDFYDLPGTVRASFSIYNDATDVERLVAGIASVRTVFKA